MGCVGDYRAQHGAGDTWRGHNMSEFCSEPAVNLRTCNSLMYAGSLSPIYASNASRRTVFLPAMYLSFGCQLFGWANVVHKVPLSQLPYFRLRRPVAGGLLMRCLLVCGLIGAGHEVGARSPCADIDVSLAAGHKCVRLTSRRIKCSTSIRRFAPCITPHMSLHASL